MKFLLFAKVKFFADWQKVAAGIWIRDSSTALRMTGEDLK